MKKSLIKLAIVAVLIVVFAYLALNGFHPSTGTRYLKPVSEAIRLGLDLSGGVSAEYSAAEQSSEENYDSRLQSTVAALRTRLTDKNFTEATVAIQGTDRILVEIPNVDNPEEVARIIGTPGVLEFKEAGADGVLENVATEGSDDIVVITGDMVRNTGIHLNDQTGLYEVGLELNSEGAAKFAEATARLHQQPIGIYMDGVLQSAPVVQSTITEGKCSISFGQSGSMTQDESRERARDTAMLIQSGSLPLDIKEVETRAISPTLGTEAIHGAVIAGIVGLILVLVFMLVMYRLPGVAADLALLIYVLIVFYALAIFGVQLTLQGIAGILLGIGMAVDANVVIFERFREEMKEGRTPLNAVKFGFKNAGRAVIDSNVTTLIAAVVLLIFGTGTIKGFAMTLMISVIVSLFTAIVVTRGLLKIICKLGIQNRSAYTR